MAKEDHGFDGLDGYMSPRCSYGMDGCDDLACVCRCHGEADDRERALAWLAERIGELGRLDSFSDRDIAAAVLDAPGVEVQEMTMYVGKLGSKFVAETRLHIMLPVESIHV